MINYIKFYKKTTNKDFDSKKYSIHHIDGNRQNNDISNLVMLPKALHCKYHFYSRDLVNPIKFTVKILSVLDGGQGYDDYAMNALENFIQCRKECCKWCDYREYLLGYIPNIHHLSTED